jgi:P4 family phage/plasmid primase-like protien
MLLKIAGNDQSLMNYLQELFGMCLSTKNDRNLYIFHGDGNNGKSTLMRMMKLVLTKYSGSLPVGSLMKIDKKSASQATTHLNAMEGKRFVVCDESDDKDELDSVIVKKIANEDGVIELRKLYSEGKEVDLTAKVFLCTNQIPRFNIGDKALLQRLRFVPFKARFFDATKRQNEDKLKENNPLYHKADKGLIDQVFKQCLDDMFTWMLEGFIRFFQNKERINEPQVVFDFGNTIQESTDTVRAFVKDCVTPRISDEKDENMYVFEYCDVRKECEPRDLIYEEYKRNVIINGGRYEDKSTFYKRILEFNIKEMIYNGSRRLSLKRSRIVVKTDENKNERDIVNMNV